MKDASAFTVELTGTSWLTRTLEAHDGMFTLKYRPYWQRRIAVFVDWFTVVGRTR